MDSAGIRGLRFLQMSQKKFPVVVACSIVHLLSSDVASDVIFGGRRRQYEFPGFKAREEGLRTLTSPRREASLFKLGPGNPGAIFFAERELD
jgi:hypothetical protein